MWCLFLLACRPPSTPPTHPPGETEDSAPLTDTAPPHDTGGPPTTARESLGLLSLNLHCLKLDGTSFTDHPSRFAAIADRAAAADVHVLALQEVCRQPGTDALAMLSDALEAATGEPWEGAFAFAHVAWEGTPDQADEGVGLLSRRGLLNPTEIAYVAPGELRRVALFAELGDGTTVATVHLDYGDALAREEQARQTASQVLAAADALDAVIAGDLNARAGTPTHDAFGAMGFVDGSAPLHGGRIDHAFVHRGAPWSVERAESWFETDPVSDHPGVFLSLAPSEPADVPITRIVAHVDVGFGHTLAVRGDLPPLSWDRGWWAWPAAADRWELVLTEVDADFAFKTLVDDASWQVGDDVAGRVGADNDVTPTF